LPRDLERLSEMSHTPELFVKGLLPRALGWPPICGNPVTLNNGMLDLITGSSIPGMISSRGRVASWLRVIRVQLKRNSFTTVGLKIRVCPRPKPQVLIVRLAGV